MVAIRFTRSLASEIIFAKIFILALPYKTLQEVRVLVVLKINFEIVINIKMKRRTILSHVLFYLKLNSIYLLFKLWIYVSYSRGNNYRINELYNKHMKFNSNSVQV